MRNIVWRVVLVGLVLIVGNITLAQSDEAVELYEDAVALYWTYPYENLEAAIELLTDAIDLAPEFAMPMPTEERPIALWVWRSKPKPTLPQR